MRNWLNLFEDEVPPVLYHGTPIENLISIFLAGVIYAREDIDEGHLGVSWTSDLHVAKSFAHSDSRDGDYLHTEILMLPHPTFKGAVLVAHGAALGRLEEYDDGGDGMKSEAEWRTFGDVPISAISGIMVDRAEIEQYRAVLLAHQDHKTKPWPQMPEENWADHEEWGTKFLTDPKRMEVIEMLLSSPMLQPFD